MLTGLLLAAVAGCRNDQDPYDLAALLTGGEVPAFTLDFSGVGVQNRGGEMEAALLGVIHLSQNTLYCAFEDLSLPVVAEALHLARLRNVDVRIGLDADQAQGYSERIYGPRIGDRIIAGNAGSGRVSMNVCVGDRKRVFVAGSPPTRAGFYLQSSFWAYAQSDPEEGVARKFNSVMDLVINRSFGSTKQRLDRRNYYLTGDLDVGIYSAPEESPLEFMAPRAYEAQRSVRIYSSEFFASKSDSSSDLRESGDLAYDTLNGRAGLRMILGSSSAYMTPDENSDVETNEGNSLRYLLNRGQDVRVAGGEWARSGISLMLIDQESARPMLAIGSFPFSAKSNSAHDGFMFVIEDRELADRALAFFESLAGRSISVAGSSAVAAPLGLEVVISEINWMGGYRADLSGTNFEYFELYSNAAAPLHLGGWTFECGAAGAFTTIATLPQGLVIGPGQYMVFTDDSSSNLILDTAHARPDFGSSDEINNTTTDQCRLRDASGTVVDLAGETGLPFSGRSDAYGLNDASAFIRRSMERINLAARGDSVSNWSTNTGLAYEQNLNIGAEFLDRSYGTPGLPNTVGVTPGAGPRPIGQLARADEKLLVWETNYDTSPNDDTNDEYVEILNNSDETINLAGGELWYMNTTPTASRIITFGAVQLQPGAVLIVISNNTAGNVQGAAVCSGIHQHADGASVSMSNTGGTALLLRAGKGSTGATATFLQGAGLAGLNSDADILDFVGWETATLAETGAANAGATADRSISRSIAQSAANRDTNNNAADFAVSAAGNGTPCVP